MVEVGAIYEFEITGELVEVVAAPDPFAGRPRSEQQIEVESLDDDKWWSDYADNFRKNYSRVADARAEV